MDKSWVYLHRSTQECKDKMELFLNEALSKSARKDKIICPCKKCCNRYYEDKIIVGGHLLWHGMDLLYMTACWTHHGESYIDSTNARQIGPIDEIGSMDLIDSEGEADDYYSTPHLDDPKLDNEEIQIRTDVRRIYVNKRVPLPIENDSIVDEDDLSDDEDETENEIEDEID
ncbi:hypothetical protein ACE6H2_020283 [Prunus campanulata]